MTATIFLLFLAFGSFFLDVAGQLECEIIGEVTNVDAFQAGDQLVVLWQEPENQPLCDFTNLQYHLNFTTRNNSYLATTSDLHYYLEYETNSCYDSYISINATAHLVTNSTTYTLVYTAVGTPTNISMSHLTNNKTVIAWTPPVNSVTCLLNYTVEWQDSSGTQVFEAVEVSSVEITYTALRACDLITISVTASRNLFSGRPEVKTFAGDVGPVTNFYLDVSDGELVTAFDPPANSELCTLSYRIVQSEVICFRSNVTVHVLNSLSTAGDNATLNVEQGMGKVSNLVANLSNSNIELQWTPPVNSEGCNVRYNLLYKTYNYSATVPNAVLSSTTVSCKIDDVVVTPISSTGVWGLPATVSIEKPLNPVTNLILSRTNEVITASWSAPANSNLCQLSYLVEYEEDGSSYLEITQNLSLTFVSNNPCLNIILSVEPHSSEGLTGPTVTTSLTDCPTTLPFLV